VKIRVYNDVDEETAMHWHGMHQRNTVESDGVPGVTQCGIHPNQSYEYTFYTDDVHGTFWYHSHSAIQYGDGIKGALIIRDPNDPWKTYYQDEDILQITEWYHTPAYILLATFLNKSGQLDPLPDSGLVNDIGQYKCRASNTCSYYRTFIKAGTTKRFRIINTSLYSTISIAIDQHSMRLIEADGIYLDGESSVRILRTSPGQRYSVLVTAINNSVPSYWIRITIHPYLDYDMKRIYAGEPNISAILQYTNDNNTNTPIVVPSMDTFDNDAEIIAKAFDQAEQYTDQPDLHPMNMAENKVPTDGSIRKILLYETAVEPEDGKQVIFTFNNQTFSHPTDDTMLSSFLHVSSSQKYVPKTIKIDAGEIIDLIINNDNFFPHPFHLHGHHAWVIARGNSFSGLYNDTTAGNISFNTINPVYRDTYNCQPLSYIVIRFQANNPGVWITDTLRTLYTTNNLGANIPTKCEHHNSTM
jgi:iron transport multicopper oxidase